MTRRPADFTPKGRDAYRFGRHWFWPDQEPDAATDVLQTTATVDDAGRSAVTVPVAADLPYPMTYEVDAETTDASNVAVSDLKTFTALPSEVLIGLRADDVGTAGMPLAVAVIASDARGASRAGTAGARHRSRKVPNRPSIRCRTRPSRAATSPSPTLR